MFVRGQKRVDYNVTLFGVHGKKCCCDQRVDSYLLVILNMELMIQMVFVLLFNMHIFLAQCIKSLTQAHMNMVLYQSLLLYLSTNLCLSLLYISSTSSSQLCAVNIA